jgi:alpha-mannosidase
MIQPVLYIILNNHFDPTWRRCFDRHFIFNGDTFVSYADLEEYYLLDHLALARQNPEYKFEAESAIVVRKFLERHPEALTELQSLSNDGRFAITGGGENIVDGNMILGESLVRNYVSGLLWVEQTFARKTRLAVRNDAFGNSAQLPQILRGVEIAWCTGFSYSPAKGRYWRGLDGSTILHATLPIAARGGGVIKYPPCQACHGVGCPACHMRGFDDTQRALLPETIHAAALEAFNAALVSITPEEYLPNPELLDWAKAQTGYEVRFALEEDVLPHLQPWLEAVDNPPEADLHPAVELNPNNSGVWVSRIQTKQNVRRQEYALLATETLATLAALQGQPYPRAALSAIWQDLLFSMFHDAITATHVDAAYAEIQGFWRKIDAGIAALQAEILPGLVTPATGKVTVMNLTGEDATQLSRIVLPEGLLPTTPEGALLPIVDITPAGRDQAAVTFLAKDVPAMGTRSYELAAIPQSNHPSLPSPLIENQRFRITADEHGLVEVFDRVLGRAILQSGQYRPGELIIEHDEGSPWATLHPDQTRTPLSQFTRLVKTEQGSGFQRLTFAVELPWSMCFASRDGVKGTVCVTLVDGLERVDFRTDVHWATFNHRLRVAFPVPVSGKHLYGIPYGMLERQPYDAWFSWVGANGDWPAVNWAGVQGEELSVALLNKGTPSYRMERGKDGGEVMLLSVLRSPAIPTYLHEPEFYAMTAYDGMRDEGDHAFEYAITTYDRPFAQTRVVADAEGYNAGLLAVAGQAKLPALPRVQSEHVRLAAVKCAEDGRQALILRFVEFRGQAGSAILQLPGSFKSAAKVNLLERGDEILPISDGKVLMKVRAWEIATLRLDF